MYGFTKREGAEVSPVDLGTLARRESQGEESGLTRWSYRAHIVLDDGHAAVVALLGQALEDLCRAVGVVFQPAADGGLERIELAGAWARTAGPVAGLGEPLCDGARTERESDSASNGASKGSCFPAGS